MAEKEESDYFPLPCEHDRALAAAWAVLRDPCTGAHRHLWGGSYLPTAMYHCGTQVTRGPCLPLSQSLNLCLEHEYPTSTVGRAFRVFPLLLETALQNEGISPRLPVKERRLSVVMAPAGGTCGEWRSGCSGVWLCHRAIAYCFPVC